MASGWASDDDTQKQIDATMDSAVDAVRSRISDEESLKYCEECGNEIPLARRKALRGIKCCIKCQSLLESIIVRSTGINRRGSKDSQLR